MKKYTALLILNTLLLLFLNQKLFAQKNDQDASIRETIDWIEGKVKEYGNFTYYFRGKNDIFNASLTNEGGLCTWEYKFSEKFYDDPERGKGSKPRNYTIKFKLKDITEVSLITVEGKYQAKVEDLYYRIELRTFNDKDKIKIKKKSFDKKRDNTIAINISDKEIAERMLKAFENALEICNKGEIKTEKF